MTPAFAGESLSERPIFFEHEGNRALRLGRYKLVARGAGGAWELYDMESDRIERDDLSAQAPERLRSMIEQWRTWAARARVFPLNPTPGKREAFSRETRFEFEHDDAHASQQSPYVFASGIDLDATIPLYGGDRKKAAWSSYPLERGKPVFLVRQFRRATRIESATTCKPGVHRVRATLGLGGEMELFVGEQSVATGAALGTLSKQPGDGISVGHDQQDAVGDYKGPAELEGRVQKLTLDLTPG